MNFSDFTIGWTAHQINRNSGATTQDSPDPANSGWMGTVDCFLSFAGSLTHIYNREGVSAVQDRQIET